MATPSSRNPAASVGYRASSSNNFASNSPGLDDHAVLDEDDDDIEGTSIHGYRRLSIPNRLASVVDIGGVNSFRSFARSWQRAAGFPEVIPRRPSFVYATDSSETGNDDIHYSRGHVESHEISPATGLLRQHFEASSNDMPAHSSSSAMRGHGITLGSSPHDLANDDFRSRERKALDTEMVSGALLGSSPSGRSSIFGNPPYLATESIIGSYDSYRSSMYGTMRRDSSPAHRPSISIDNEWEDDDDEDAAHGEHEPILVKEVKQGTQVILAVEGQSTLPQSIFNSINAIIGVGILSLPLAFKMSGWAIGFFLMTLMASVTSYTGQLLGKCMNYDASIITYSDLAYVAFGPRARMVVSALFSLELVAACVALVILFADSLDLLIPGLAGVNTWKCVCAGLVLVLNALPLRFLSYTSVIGIFSTFGIVCIIIMDGIIKGHSPGSLREPAATYLFPSNWLALPLAYGLMASPWGAHSIFPSIYRDMRHPVKWGRAVKVTFSFSYILDMCLGIVGILMFGDGVTEAITSNVIRTQGYPKALTIVMCCFVAIIPLTKIPLNARPLVTTADVLCGVHDSHHHHHHEQQQQEEAEESHIKPDSRASGFIRVATRGAIRIGIVLILLVISIAFPAFDSVCAFLGAAMCTLISIILPITFYLRLYWKDITRRDRTVLLVLLVFFSILGLLGTVWTFLPKDLIGV